ncbi:methyl-accepting chemotaxis protein [Anaerotignum faecicola]|nr:methyl-accepting chemotaxis protein [Anaerotignum faecicola]
MKKVKNLKHKIIFYVMSVSIFLSVLIIAIMSVGSLRSTNSILLDNMQITSRIAAQSISSNLHLLSERIYNLSIEEVFINKDSSAAEKKALLDNTKLQIEFVWLSAYDLNGKKLFGDETSPASISDTKYFSDLKETENTVIGEPHYENEVLQLCIGSPMKENGEIVGYIVGSYKYDLLNDIISLLILGDTGSACILNEDGKIIADQNLQNIVNEISIYDLYTTDENAAVIKKALAFETGSSLMASNNRNYYIGYAPVPGTNWALLVNAPQNEFMEPVLFSIAVSVILAIILLIIAAAIIIPVSGKISSSISAATKRLQGLAEGNLTEEVVLSNSNDEAGLLTNALSKTIKSLNHYIQNIESCLGALSSGDYTIEIPDSFYGDFTSIKHALENITVSLNKTMTQVNISSIEVSKNSKEVSGYAKRLYDGSENQAVLLEQLQESMEYITSTIEQNKENALQIVHCSQNASEKTSLGDGYMQSMLNTMNDIHSGMQEISKISKLIEDISSQTSILSLNASVEAARAGQAGKGFAVVASEIGRLAKQTSNALKQTSEIIEKSSTTIQKGLDTAGHTAKAFHAIQNVTSEYEEISLKLTNIVENQINAITNVNEQLNSLRNIADENRSLAEETDHMAEGFLNQSERLKDFVLQVKLKKNIL